MNFHNVAISDLVLEDTVQLAHRYVQDRFTPDKVIDLLDRAAAQLRVLKPRPAQNALAYKKEQRLVDERYERGRSTQKTTKAAKHKQRRSKLRTVV